MGRFRAAGIWAAALAAASPAHASHLVGIVDAPPGKTAIARRFTATGPTTLLIFGGYEVPSFWQATGITVTGPTRATNLLQPVWAFTPAPIDSLADQAFAPRIMGLEFGGTCVGSYDLFSQSFSTIAGQMYQLRFLFTQDFAGPNGLKVSVDETLAQARAESALPEPETWTMVLAGFAMLGIALRRANAQPESLVVPSPP